MRTLTLSLSLAVFVVACGDDGGKNTSNAESSGGSEGQTTSASATEALTTGSGTDAPTTSGVTTTGESSTSEPTTATTTSEPNTTGTTGTPAVCGDSQVDDGEECDDGNVVYMVQFGACCSNSIIYVS